MPKGNDVETVERVIHAPASAIFDLLANPHQHPHIGGSGTVRDTKPNARAVDARVQVRLTRIEELVA